MLEWVAVVLGERPFSRGADVGEDEVGADLGRESFQVHTVPSRQSGSEDAGVGSKMLVRVPADTKPVAIDGAAGVKTETRVVGLGEDGVGGFCYQFAEHDGLIALIYLEHLSKWYAEREGKQRANLSCFFEIVDLPGSDTWQEVPN